MPPVLPGVLIVNDREAQRVAIRAMLAPLGLAVVEADSGLAALRAVLRHTFALILMDVRMPVMDGYETAHLIRQRRQSCQTPIIFVTAFGREDTETLTAYASGAVDFIFTPVVPDVLRAKVSVFVELAVQSQALQRSLESITTLNAALRDSEASTQAVLDNVADGIVTVGRGGLIESVNRSAQALFGFREEELVGQPLARVIPPRSDDEPRGSAATETLGRRHDGSSFPMEVEQGQLVLGDRTVTLAFVRDISERRAYTEGLEHEALHDALTGLANRTLFGESVVQALASARRTNEQRAVLVMDLNEFKQVNDTFGHDHGDILLRQISERLTGALREADTIARLGGDEFAILPGGATDLASASQVAWKVQQAFAAEFTLGDEPVRISASVGIAVFPEHGKTTHDLLRRADAAMYVAKRSGSGHAVFDAARETQATQRLALLDDLRQCIAHEQLVLHYQPKIDLTTRAITGVEALLRWQQPGRGLLTPDRFMADVERTALIEPVTRWVLSEALHQQQAWGDDGVDLAIAVNISAQSLRLSSRLPEIIKELTDACGTAPGRLTLELSESALVEAAAPDILARLHGMGHGLSTHDYGTGYSSVVNLHRLPIDEIKIDRSLVTHLHAGGDNAVIVRSLIDLAHNLGLTVVAEGVEGEAALDVLVACGCDSAQGSLFGPPCPADEFGTWLRESPYGPPIAAGSSQANTRRPKGAE